MGYLLGNYVLVLCMEWSNEYPIKRRDEKGIVSLYKSIGNGGFAQYMYFNISTSHLIDHIVSHILLHLGYKHSFILIR